eukprot:GEMP01079118.1.p1 GENE.GEMP01079118.1~~GEMP01079118.1.p1  ORF type:complete len:146 (-),score=6.36 GEMP01079118.1:119-556(-)
MHDQIITIFTSYIRVVLFGLRLQQINKITLKKPVGFQIPPYIRVAVFFFEVRKNWRFSFCIYKNTCTFLIERRTKKHRRSFFVSTPNTCAFHPASTPAFNSTIPLTVRICMLATKYNKCETKNKYSHAKKKRNIICEVQTEKISW